MSVCLSVCMSVREDICRTTCAIFIPIFVHVAYVRGSVLLQHVYDRPHRLSPGRGFLPHCKCIIIVRKRGIRVHSAVKVCYLLLPCLRLATYLRLARIDLRFDVRLASKDVRLALDSAFEICAHLCQLQTSKSPELMQGRSLELTTAYLQPRPIIASMNVHN